VRYGIETPVFAVPVVAPVVLEVAVRDQRAKPEDGFGRGESPADTGDVEAVGDQMSAGALDL
jgi:hypothetical protein